MTGCSLSARSIAGAHLGAPQERIAMDVTLTAETGRPNGSSRARRLRAAGKVPAVVYGLDQEPVAVTVEWLELRRALNTEAGLNALITLDLDGQQDLTIVKTLQRDPVRRTVEHVDFLRIDRNASITVEVPVALVGEAKEVEQNQGIVEQLLHSVTVEARPGSIPTGLELDISGLEIGGAVRVGDLTLPEGVTTPIDPDEQVAIGSVTRAAMVEEEEAAEGEEVEGEEAEGEGGAEGAEAASGGESQ
jgi:large subunit ribosomal protein L25